MKTKMENQDNVLRIRDDNEIHGAILSGENRFELTSVKRNVKFIDDAFLTFTLNKNYTFQKFEKLPPIDYNKVQKNELEKLRKWFDKNMVDLLPMILAYSTSEENLLKIKNAITENVSIFIVSGEDTDHSHLLIDKELFGL